MRGRTVRGYFDKRIGITGAHGVREPRWKRALPREPSHTSAESRLDFRGTPDVTIESWNRGIRRRVRKVPWQYECSSLIPVFLRTRGFFECVPFLQAVALIIARAGLDQENRRDGFFSDRILALKSS